MRWSESKGRCKSHATYKHHSSRYALTTWTTLSSSKITLLPVSSACKLDCMTEKVNPIRKSFSNKETAWVLSSDYYEMSNNYSSRYATQLPIGFVASGIRIWNATSVLKKHPTFTRIRKNLRIVKQRVTLIKCTTLWFSSPLKAMIM